MHITRRTPSLRPSKYANLCAPDEITSFQRYVKLNLASGVILGTYIQQHPLARSARFFSKATKYTNPSQYGLRLLPICTLRICDFSRYECEWTRRRRGTTKKASLLGASGCPLEGIKKKIFTNTNGHTTVASRRNGILRWPAESAEVCTFTLSATRMSWPDYVWSVMYILAIGDEEGGGSVIC